MNIGMQVFNESSELMFDSTVQTTRVLGTFDTGSENGSKSISVPNGMTLWATTNYATYQALNGKLGVSYPKIKVTGNVISWTFSNPKNWMFGDIKKISVNIIYGVL